MHTIANILEDFFYCLQLPIKAIDENYNLIYSVGVSEQLEDFTSSDLFIEKIKGLKENYPFSIIDFENNINFLLVPISKFDKNKGFFIVGPFRSVDNTYRNIHYLPDTCIKYIYNLLITIVDDKFSKGRINNQFSPHVKKAVEYSIKNFDSPISIDSICNELNINKSYFCKIFKSETGYTFTNFLNIFRVEKSKKLLKNSNMSLLDVAVSVGFNSQNYYSSVFKKITNKTPLEYKQEIKL
ncbi:helix-turn-helix transcriptional regulator [Romboutsia ilealis]|uniref:helix-turn-helix transcriptional regulator n=1 Tax=Romboutsia ilealis TaxID=1115758 RepID=UPI00272A6C24|nr:helix-turn-helix transcriptional regulator [Romboutsia ilealis]